MLKRQSIPPFDGPPAAGANKLLARLTGLAEIVGQGFTAQWIFFVVPALFLISNAWFMRHLTNPLRAPLWDVLVAMLTMTVPAGLFALFMMRLLQLMFIIKPEHPVRVLVADIREFVTSPLRIANGLPLFAARVLFNKVVLEFKPAIPQIIPFAWDESLMRLDRAIHFGVDPWRLLQPIVGYAWITFAINLVYNFWFLLFFGMSLWFGFRPDFTLLRTRFFLTYFIAWWVGGLLALYFSSAGPCYYGLVVQSNDPFAPLMNYLHEVNSYLPLWALDAQRVLWDGYTGTIERAMGISAFPSMHNTMAVIFVIVGYRLNRCLGRLCAVNLAVILVGSIHLGWHYAIDAYAGIALGLVAWWIAGPITDWFHGLASSRAWEDRLAHAS